MKSDEIRALLHRSYDAFNKGERLFVLDLFHDDIEWIMHSPPEAMPIPNRVQGKFNVLAALKRIDDVIEAVRTDLELVVVEDDRAVAICDNALRQRGSGRIIRYKSATFHQYRDGKLIQYQAFFDGFDILQQVLGREIPVPQVYPS
ncbi:MAG: nuclear transport factor 2 family protein [Pseudomonadota bacterium]